MKVNPKAVEFSQVAVAELEDILHRRGVDPPTLDRAEWVQHCHDQKLFGVSISGGGIRSATFALGVLQGLEEKKLLSKADYLSTVSGGGYIGSWLQGVLKRDQSYEALTRKVPGPSSEDPITFLRKYSNYLAPRHGFSVDTLLIPLIWFRNMMLNQAIIISAFAALFLLVSWPGIGLHQLAVTDGTTYSWVFLGLSVALALVTVISLIYNLSRIAQRESDPDAKAAFPKGKGTGAVWKLVVLPIFLAVIFLTCTVTPKGAPLWSVAAVGGLLLWILFAALQWRGGFVLCFKARRNNRGGLVALLHIIWMSLASTGLTWLLFVLVTRLVISWDVTSSAGSQFTMAWAPALYSLALMAGMILQIGLMGQDFPDSSREWLARTGALLLTITTVWAALFAIAVFLPLGVAQIWVKSKAPIISVATAWIASTVMSVLAGKSSKTGRVNGNGANQSQTIDRVARYGPFIAVPGFLVAVAFFAQVLLHINIIRKPGSFFSNLANSYWDSIAITTPPWIYPVALLILFTVIFLVLSVRVNINEFSMHHFYKNRLVRCYLGASATKTRAADSFTGFDPQDDLPLADVRYNASQPLHVPYPIVNATLTVTAGSDLASQERKALPWIFTPHYSGFFPGRSEADRIARGEAPEAATFVDSKVTGGGGLHLGTAMAISGAAVNPNSGYHSSAQTAFLLTLFDVRLGWWMGNPMDANTYQRSGPLLALWWLGRELFGFVDESSSYLNLSDGGHFENLGLYELVRRRCHYVIAIDGEADSDYHFGSLGGAVRKCRTDFGVEIEIDPRPIRPRDGLNGSHCVVGRIHYPEPNSAPGWLLYLKSSITGDEPADVEEYRSEHSEFPQQSTAQQFFSESQFESYRRLGLHVANKTLHDFEPGSDLEEAFERLGQKQP